MARPMRYVWVVAGVALMAFGVRALLFGDTNGTRPVASAVWAAGGLVLHDGVLAPAVFVTGWLLPRVLPRRVRTVALPVLVLAGVCALLLVPHWRSPASRQNASVNPPSSATDIALAVLVGLAALGAAHGVAALLSARARRSSGRPGATAP